MKPLASLLGQNCSVSLLSYVSSVLGLKTVLSWGPSWPVVLEPCLYQGQQSVVPELKCLPAV